MKKTKTWTMATVNQPLLGSPKATYPCCKALLLTISITAGLCLATLATLHLTTTNHFHICEKSKNPNSCHAILSSVATFHFLPPTKLQLLKSILKNSVPKINGAISTTNDIHRRVNDPKLQPALADCATLMDLSRDRVEDSILALDSLSTNSISSVHSWLSAVLTNHVTCSDGLHGPAKSMMEVELQPLMELASTSLAIVNAMSPPSNGELPMPPTEGFPSWVTQKDRKLLQSSPNAIKADVVVAQDGSGKYKTVQEAVTAAPDNSKTRYVIYVKKGTYKEKVDVGKTKKNIMIVGDGLDSTIITGSLNFIDGTTTFNSATLAAVGDGFMAQDIWIQNTAGAQKHQAVALRVGADQSVINRCRIDGYQDTLYAHSLRQFYRDCSISGTVDFIFGNAAVVLQNCKLIANKPMSNQQNLVTAQGRTDPNQNTGTSIQNCQISASSDLSLVKRSIPTYLGRPWKEYSRTVVMQSNIGDHIAPAGWLEWSGDFALKTLYYGEYMNNGPGAGTANRVKWPGYRVITSANEAGKFTVAQLIQGGQWLKATGVTFTEGL